MGKYAYVKLSIILYHKQTDLSICFAKFLEKYFSSRLWVIKKAKSIAAILTCKSRFDSGIFCYYIIFVTVATVAPNGRIRVRWIRFLRVSKAHCSISDAF